MKVRCHLKALQFFVEHLITVTVSVKLQNATSMMNNNKKIR